MSYNNYHFENGKVLTADQLNNMSDGIADLYTKINQEREPETLVYSEQNLSPQYIMNSGSTSTSAAHHQHFSISAAGVKSITIHPTVAGPSSSVSYIVHVNAAGVATPYVNVKDAALQSTTIEFDGSAGTIYFNYFTDEQSYVYVKEAVVTYMTYDLETLAGDVAENSMRISNLEAGGGSSSTSYSNAIDHHCVNRPYDFKDKTALYFGDSITNGWTSGKKADNGGFPTLFSNMVGLTFTNYGKNSTILSSEDTSKGIFGIIKSTTLESDYLFIAGGVNDWQTGVSLTTFRTGVTNLCAYLKANYSGEVIFITPLVHAGWNPVGTPVAELQSYRDIITELALTNGYSVVQGNQFNFPTQNGNAAYIAAVFADKLHPSELGYELYAKHLRTILC